MADLFDLQRFIDAQDAGGTYDVALRELRAGRKTGHWMWFVFPQLAGLGRSPTARHYAVRGADEARAYLAHPVLGPRLRECVALLLALERRTIDGIMGSSIDARKLRSSMTLFHRAEPAEALFRAVLDRYFGGVPDGATDAILSRPSAPPPGS